MDVIFGKIFWLLLTLQVIYARKVTVTGSDEADRYLKVLTENGLVKGYLASTCGNKIPYAGFRGIPFAEPPLGKLRFKAPVKKSNWSGIYNATYQRPGCMQTEDKSFSLTENTFSEDCLYVNVFTPNLDYLKNTKPALKPVMVYIYGGAFLTGASFDTVYGPDFLLDEDVVVVSFNYRLGAFGFLSFQNDIVPGNAGLKDQAMALKWVKKNIQAFGGDPQQITVFGESAGSASVNYHLLSDSSKGLFRAAIMESGSVLSSWAFSPPDVALSKANELAKKLQCHSKDVKDIIECMQGTSAEELLNSQLEVLSLEDVKTMRVIPFEPTVEPKSPGAFLSDYPFNKLFAGNFTKVPVIMGSNSEEGYLVYPTLVNNPLGDLLIGFLAMDLSRFAPNQLRIKPATIAAIQVHQAIGKHYFNGKLLTKQHIPQLLELVGDVNFILPIQLTASIMSQHSPAPVYNYHFTYDGGYAAFKAVNNIELPGVCHADELGYLFYSLGLHNHCAYNTTESQSFDDVIVKRMTKMWTNFAKTGNPIPKTDNLLSAHWYPFTPASKEYLEIGDTLIPSNNLKANTMIFWDDVITKVLKKQGKLGKNFETSDLFNLSY